MKCPKCGFNSFEYYETCKKCSNELTGYKQTYSIRSLVLPLEAKERLVAESRIAGVDQEQSGDMMETHDDMFNFDVPETVTATSARNDDPFNFDDSPAETIPSGGSMSEEDMFADLLETSSQSAESPFSAAQSAPASPSKVSASTSAPGEFDLENFSWDDTAVATASDAAAQPDDFDSLFGDVNETAQK